MTDAPLFAQLGYSKELYDIRQKNGSRLLAVAWIIEITAAGIGFAIALITILQAVEARPTQVSSNDIAFWGTALVGGLPFFMCGIVELCKIPIATLVYHSESLFWKLLFIAAMVLLSIVTFETMAAGMQQSYQLRTGGIQILAQKIMQKEQAFNTLEEDLSAREDKSQNRGSFVDRRNVAMQAARDRREEIDSENETKNNSARESFGESKSDSTQASIDQLRLDRKLEDERFEKDLSTINFDYKTKLGNQNENYKTQLDNITKKMETASDNLEKRLDECKARFVSGGCAEKANADQTAILKDLDRQEEDARRAHNLKLSEIEDVKKNENSDRQAQYDNTRASLNGQINKLSAELAKSSSTTRDGLDNMLQENEQKRQAKIAEVNQELEQNLQRVQQEENDYLAESAPESLNVIRADMRDLRSESDKMKAELDTQTSRNQTYQIAKLAKSMCLFVPDRASCLLADQDIRMADIPSSYVDKVAMFWFGSLAFIISTTGVLLAFGAMVLKYEHISQQKASRGILGMFSLLLAQIARIWNASLAFIGAFFDGILKLIRSQRKFIIEKRKAALREPLEVEKIVEITKEVAVDNIVIKEVEVIKEVPVEHIVIKEVEVIKEVSVEKIVPTEVEVIKEVFIEKIVIEEVEVIKEVFVEKIVIEEVPVEKIVIEEVEIIKEVPVEKIVIKEVEKKVPVKTKEFVYVPFYTDDPEERDKLNEKVRAVEDEINMEKMRTAQDEVNNERE